MVRKIRIVILLALAAAAGMAQVRRTVEELTGFVRQAIEQKAADKQVAAAVEAIQLKYRLDETTVAELQRAGAGPKTVAALRHLSQISASLPPEPQHVTAVAFPPPSEEVQKSILADVRENALNYTDNLPNYLCTQVTKRRVDPTGSGNWRVADTILEHLSFFDHKESYKVIMVNDSPVTRPLQHDQLGGATSSGEFGSILHSIFAPEVQTEFGWARWATLRGQRTLVFTFHTGVPMYSIRDEESKREVTTRTHGEVLVDQATRMVMRISMECEGIPADFPIQSVSVLLDYDFGEISGKQYLLPLHSSIRSREGRMAAWNEVSYVAYRKFGTESSITFDTPDIPADKLKETPPKQQ
jgi:hypothetical protein